MASKEAPNNPTSAASPGVPARDLFLIGDRQGNATGSLLCAAGILGIAVVVLTCGLYTQTRCFPAKPLGFCTVERTGVLLPVRDDVDFFVGHVVKKKSSGRNATWSVSAGGAVETFSNESDANALEHRLRTLNRSDGQEFVFDRNDNWLGLPVLCVLLPILLSINRRYAVRLGSGRATLLRRWPFGREAIIESFDPRDVVAVELGAIVLRSHKIAIPNSTTMTSELAAIFGVPQEGPP